MESFEKQCEEFHYFHLTEIRRQIEIDISEGEFDTAIKYLTHLKIFWKKNEGKIYPIGKSFKFYHLRLVPDFEQEIENFKMWVEKRKAETKVKIPPAKYYAFHYWILISLGEESQFQKNDDGKWPKTQMINFFENKYPKQKNHQGIYKDKKTPYRFDLIGSTFL